VRDRFIFVYFRLSSYMLTHTVSWPFLALLLD
jgi:hypothetical protein